jgi:hypothetical protein
LAGRRFLLSSCPGGAPTRCNTRKLVIAGRREMILGQDTTRTAAMVAQRPPPAAHEACGTPAARAVPPRSVAPRLISIAAAIGISSPRRRVCDGGQCAAWRAKTVPYELERNRKRRVRS